MSRKGKLQISNRYQEIVQVLQKAKLNEGNFLWRVTKDSYGIEHRQKFSITIKEIDTKKSRLEFEVSDQAIRELNVGDSVYCKLVARNSAFKGTVLQMQEKLLICSFPDEAAITELRALRRHYFHPADEKYVQLRRMKNQVVERSDKTFNLLVCDISQTGLCLFVPESQQYSIDVRHRIRIEMLGPFRLEEPMVGEVVFKIPHMVKEALANKPGVRVGIQLDQKIPTATFERFIVKKQALSISDDRIVLDEAFRAKVHENMSEIREALRKNKRFDKFFDLLLVPKAGNQYLKQHIELLCEVLCGLAVRLGWVSERSIDKLIYVAFLHDVRFTQYPKLAQIQSLKAFEAQKLYLSDNERKAFLESPAYSSELARQDLEAYPDAITVLTQQKELPDGTGFPHKLTSAQIAPLSSLFITAHYFVDYVIDHPDWSVEDFVRSYSKRLNGPYFERIFEAMSNSINSNLGSTS